MNRIRLLSEQVANQIAAGEVIERPASVVKELVENALDAGARRIQVEIQAGGRSMIRVTDDGVGMNRDDALLCFERHATSKIRRAEDLTGIATLGFRGEALPSIASVSRLTLTTRERDDPAPEATQVVFNGGRLVEVRSASSPSGTAVEVRSLFFNLPARRKFLKSQETEWAHIQHCVLLAALAHPQVGFSLMHEQRFVWQLPPVATDETPAGRLAALRERLRALTPGVSGLLAVDAGTVLPAWDTAGSAGTPEPTEAALGTGDPADRSPGGVRLWGFIGVPGLSRATREEQHLFVNRRPVENRALNYALLEGYHTALMKGRYPVCCLFLEIDPGRVDVNIHPAKREVRFREERAVRAFVTAAIRDVLLAFHRPAVVSPMPAPGDAGPAASVPDEPVQPAEPARPADTAPQPPLFPVEPAPAPAPVSRLPSQSPGAGVAPSIGVPEAALGAGTRPEAAVAAMSAAGGAAAPGSGDMPLLGVPLRALGVIGRLYVVLESDRGLVLLDQHAAHERVLYEQMLARMEQGNAPSQRLLLPETVELPPREAQFVRENLPVLVRLGVGLSEFGERTFLLDAVPPFVKLAEARSFVMELVDGLQAAGREVNSMRLGEQMVAKTVCRHAIKAHDPLAPDEIESLLSDLRRCAMPYTCPHGRPTIIELSFRELDRKFGRITS